ncbi:uncharacterized protein Z520_02885 [Fonsecaea multimorphosa CBS 102226]|uniref:Uncharacterized protein n=1 Tax=Fonsecaea multimorphosa CBS 102226 TaxID=1442371 RepID=A0A0D2K678_9EURO|nr:uncharacterized protein Z520_02885 [Fonsecaea multimorphosa CBS 102226]KIY01333.1 hypothetical protein Z520_02885 [Fonsecaea multimorphosa CBS 102226]OAL28610.1 hypothetical protein AYO22_02804 [Fonsecaea multimorphosa]
MSSSMSPIDNKTESSPIGISVVEVNPSLSSRDGPVSDPNFAPQEQWQPGFWKRFPWVGFGCLLMVVVFSTVAIIILKVTNDRPVSSWPQKMPPNVILSVCNSGTSICIAIAVAQGIAVSWWRRAMKGATIADLHNTWAFGSSIASVVLNVKYFNIAALAAIVTKITIIDGILFQRSTSTYVRLGPNRDVNITTFPTPQLPFTAKLNEAANDTSVLTFAFTSDVMNWDSSAYGQPYQPNGFTECQGICNLTVLAPGYIANCTNHHAQMRSVDPVGEAAAHVGPNKTHANVETILFSVSFNTTFPTAAKNYTWIGLNLTYNDVDSDAPATQKCPLKIWTKQCELREAMLKYPLYLEFANGTTTSPNDTNSQTTVYFGSVDPIDGTLDPATGDFDDHKGQIPGFDFEHWIAEATAWRPTSGALTRTGGIARALSDRYKSTATLNTTSNDKGSSYYLSTTGQLSGTEEYEYGTDGCPLIFVDPMTDIMVGLNTLTFLTAQDLYNRPTFLDNPDADWDAYSNSSRVFVPASERRPEVYYQTKYGWMFGALASTLVCVLLVLPSYWGFWELGRKVTLNPIEVANAFQAPAFAPAHPRSGLADDIVKVAGERVVRYTVAEASERGGAYRIVPL